MSALKTTELGHLYRDTWALRHCCVQVDSGQVAGLVGANGAGKTTLLLMLMGLLEPTEGDVRVHDLSPYRDARAVLPRVGFVAQDHPLYKGFQVRELLQFGRHLNGSQFDIRRATLRLSDAGIPMRRRVGKLSGGQRAQVALALALAKRPDVLILDEPVASLDPLARRDFLAVLMDAVATDGMAVLLSSHLVSDLERVCDDLIVLAGGRVRLAGPVEELIADHRLLTGPTTGAAMIAQAVPVVQSRSAGRSTSLLIRGDLGLIDPAWRADPVDLEELAVAYMQIQPTSTSSGR